MLDYTAARTHMVQSQLAPNGVFDPRVIQAFMAIPRELFVPPALRPVCYTDKELDLGQGRYLLEPMLLAKMIEALHVQPGMRALCMGGATGYGAAIMSQLVGQVTDWENDHGFDDLNRSAIDQMGLSNISRLVSNFNSEIKNQDGFDVILVEGAMADEPNRLAHYLQCGGRIVAIIVPEGSLVGSIMVIDKSKGGFLSSRPLCDAYAPYLPGCAALRRFSFG